MIIRPTDRLLQAIHDYLVGDGSAFDTIYSESVRYVTQSVLNVANRSTTPPSQDLIQDIIQDTYLTVATKLDTLNDPNAFLQWAGRIATNHAQRAIAKEMGRMQRETSEEELLTEPMDDRFIPEDILQNAEAQRLIRQALEELPLNQYLCVVEYFYNGLKEAQVAEKLGMPLNSVKTNLSRAKKKLRSVIETTEKKEGIRLHSLAWLVLCLHQLNATKLAIPAAQQAAVMHHVRSHSGSGSAGAPTRSHAPARVAPGVPGAAAGAASGAAAVSSVAVKAAALVAAVGVLIGGTVLGAGLAVKQRANNKASTAQTTEETEASTTYATDPTEPAEPQVITLVSQKRTYAPDGALTNTVDYTYDDQGNLIKQISSAPNIGNYETIEYSYNAEGLLIEKTVTNDSNTCTVIYTYNEDDLCVKETTIISGSEQVTAIYTYDASGNMLSVEYPGIYTLFNTYNADNQLIRQTSSNGYYHNYVYDTAGRLVCVLYYDRDGHQLEDRTEYWEYSDESIIRKQNQPTGECYIYTYDLQGNELSLFVVAENYAYDYHYEYDFIEITIS